MTLGKTVILAMGMAILTGAAGFSRAEEAGAASAYSADAGGAHALVSLRRNASVTVGGEVRTDYSYRSMKTSGTVPRLSLKNADLSIRQANLRILADAHPNVRAVFKLNFGSSADAERDRDDIMEEALLVMHSVGGTGFGFFAGKGRAPYGQDVTLGLLQSYHHASGRADSSEGRIFIIDPPDEISPSAPASPSLGPMRPGQLDRVFLAGVSYEWTERWKAEAAVFQPNDWEYRERLTERHAGGAGSMGAAGRLWWRPFEELTLEVSAVMARSHAMGRPAGRRDVSADARGTDTASAVSAGFDWRRDEWRVFGEYQHGWDWNFTKGYRTDTWQAGAAWEFAPDWQAGGMAETLRIDDRGRRTDTYYKLAFSIQYMFSSGLSAAAEYGHEWFRRQGGAPIHRRSGNFFGIRLGFSF